MQALWGGGTTPQKFEEQFVKRVAELTDGTLQISLFSRGQIVPNEQAFDAVRNGAYQLMKTFDSYAAGKIPALNFTASVPFGLPRADELDAWFHELGGLKMAQEAYAPAGLTYIAPTVYGEEPIHSKFPIRSLGDIRGKKGRFAGLPATVLAEFGVAVSPIPTAEIYSAFEKGLIDFADLGDLQADYEQGIHEVAKYVILPGFSQPSTATSYVANTRAYEALTDRQKNALLVAAGEVGSALHRNIVAANAVYTKKYKEASVEFIQLDEQEIRQARTKAAPIWIRAAKGDPLATKIIESQISFMRDLGHLA
jgi:TRAP-type mannitol/chloroaromatic compound transport system substrate-binding protein